jgi:invasion protein IalB
VDWELICQTDAIDRGSTVPDAPGNAAETSCRISQRLVTKGSAETVFMVNIVTTAATSLPVMIISTPLGGYLAPGMELRIDKGQSMRVLYETCTTSGCHAGVPLTETVRNALLAGTHLRVRLWTTRSEPVDVDVSLAGVTAAMNALAESRR